jgi:hypothetical protein
MPVKRSLLFLAFIFILFWAFFIGLQNDDIYHNSLGLVSDTWQNINGERKLLDQPFNEVNDSNYVQWDASHYKSIRDHGYDVGKTQSDFIFAFFPLFPLIWKISFLPPLGILFLNYTFFTIAILIFSSLFSTTRNYFNNILIACSLPSLIIFFIPYTEATFLLMSSVGVYGFINRKYFLFFIGFLLASLTRSAYVFVGLSFICTELFFYFEHKKPGTLLKNCLLRIAPLIAGTAIVSITQLMSGSNSFTKFIEVQKYWDHVFGMPRQLRDWSHESFSINIGVLILILFPVAVLIVKKTVTQLLKVKDPATNQSEDPKYYLIILSLCYTLFLTLFIIFFQAGSLHNLFRYSISSPFFYMLLLGAYPLVEKQSTILKVVIISLLSLIALYVLGHADYSPKWNYSDMGIFLVILSCGFWLFQEYSNTKVYKFGLYSSIFMNLVWTCYLFNTYIINGWIFA